MSALTPASEVILRHTDQFINHRLLLAGDIQDSLACQLDAADVHVWCSQYHHWQTLQLSMGEHVHFGLLADPSAVASCDLLIYYWPKSKQEAQFQLTQLLALLPAESELLVVGENRSGVRSVETLLADSCAVHKIDSARRCGLYHAKIIHPVRFDLADWWQHYYYQDIKICALPGVFSRDGVDPGSQLLLSTLEDGVQGEVLDMGCGAGVLAASLAKRASGPIKLTLSDVNAAALASSQATMQANGLESRVIASDLFSAIDDRFNLIISNPPFHEGRKTSLCAAEQLIRNAPRHLHPGGELRIVANAFLPYPQWLDQAFGHHQVMAQTGKFKVYQAVYAPGSHNVSFPANRSRSKK